MGGGLGKLHIIPPRDRITRPALGPVLRVRSGVLACLSIVSVCVFFFLAFSFSDEDAGRIVTAWTETPTKWYPLPIAVGALLLVAIQYRKKVKQAQKEVHLDENGVEVVKLKGPWHVRSIVGVLYITSVTKCMWYTGSCDRCPPSTEYVSFVGIHQLARVASVV